MPNKLIHASTWRSHLVGVGADDGILIVSNAMFLSSGGDDMYIPRNGLFCLQTLNGFDAPYRLISDQAGLDSDMAYRLCACS